MSAGDVLVREHGGDGICAANNRILEKARAIEDCEGVVLLHDDTELGEGSRDQLLDALRAPQVCVVGVVGGRDLYGPQWVDARHRAGYADDFYGWRRYGPGTADVDAVDGLLLALSPSAFGTLEFDSGAFPSFHGYDTDFCLQARRVGPRVRVAPVDYVHRDKGGVEDTEAFSKSAQALTSRWRGVIRPLDLHERLRLGAERWVAAEAGRARHRVMVGVKRLARRQG